MVERSAKLRKVLKNILIVLAISVGILAAPAIFVEVLFFSTVPWHNLTLWRIDRALEHSIKHLADSEVVERHTFFGTRSDLNECTYEAGEIRSTAILTEKVLQWYENSTVGILGFDNHISVRTIILGDDPDVDIDDPAEAWVYDFIRNVATSSPQKTYYLVYLYEPDKPWFGDYRCMD